MLIQRAKHTVRKLLYNLVHAGAVAAWCTADIFQGLSYSENIVTMQR
jgi:hypothetical protein